jgi:CO/xanthine dehydrogenase FAD-binding subunit
MATFAAYHRPATLEEALGLLERPNALPMGGGTSINATPPADAIEVVDLQALGLDGVERCDRGRLLIGGTTTLQELVEDDDDELPAVIRETARRAAPSTLRAAATVGGCVATAAWDSELLAALLVYDAIVKVIKSDGVHSIGLPEVFGHPELLRGGIITAITVETAGVAAVARTGRTVADRAIVAAVARRCPDGTRRLAVCGVAATPVLVADATTLDPPADFRGSSAYRRALAVTLSARVLADIG